MAKTVEPLVSNLIDDDPYSDRRYHQIKNNIQDLYFQMQPYERDRNREIVKKVYAGDQSDTPYSPEWTELEKKHSAARKELDDLLNGRYSRLVKNLGRKEYKGFSPSDRATDGSKDITGSDRLYALYEYALKHDLDFGKVLAYDLESYPDRGIPKTLEFSNDKFELFPGRIGGDHWRKATPQDLEDYKKNGDRFGAIKDGWRHISTGTNYGNDIFQLLGKENFK
jgi:hypothetical protein